MALTHYACDHCGGWILWFDTQEPLFCSNCMDVRNALPSEPFSYTSLATAQHTYTTSWQETLPGLWEFQTTPQLGLGSHGWLLIREEGNIAFEAAPWYDTISLEFIHHLGGISILSASHPHGYGALWQLQQEFNPQLLIHKNDLQHTKAFKVNQPIDDEYSIDENYKMVRLGGHYEGQTALFASPLKTAFLGDALKIEFDSYATPIALSCHKGFHYNIPLTHSELEHYKNVFERFAFEHVCTPFEFGKNIGQLETLGLIDHLLKATPHTNPIGLKTLYI